MARLAITSLVAISIRPFLTHQFVKARTAGQTLGPKDYLTVCPRSEIARYLKDSKVEEEVRERIQYISA
jgi:hypothetical protein